jgi:hypothetical protein
MVVSETVLRYSVDRNSVSEARRTVAVLKQDQLVLAKSSGVVAQQTASVSAELAKLQRQKAPTELARAFADLAAEAGAPKTAIIGLQNELTKLGATADEVEKAAAAFDTRYTAAVERAADAQKRLTNQAQRSTRGGRESFDVGAFGTAGSATGGFVNNFNQDIGGVFQTAGDAGDLLEGLQRLPQAFTGITAAINPVSAAVVALGVSSAIAVNQIIQGSAQLSSEIAADIQASTNLRRSIAEGFTSDEANQKIADLIKKREAELAIIDEQNAKRDEANRIAQEAGLAGQAALALFNAADEAEQKNADIIAGARENAEAYGAEIQALRKATLDGSLAANDAAAAERKLAEERVKAAETQANDLASGIRSAVSLVTSGAGTAELKREVESTTAARNAEIEVQRQLRAAGLENTEVFKQSQAVVSGYNTKLAVLNGETFQAAARANDAATGFTELNKALTDFEAEQKRINAQRNLAAGDARVDEGNRTADRDADLKRQLEQQEAQHKANLLSIQQRGNDRIAELQKQLAEKITSNNAAITKAQADYEKAEIKARQDYLARRKAIEDKAALDALDSLIENDITGYLRTQRQKETDLGALDSAEAERAAEAKAALDERVAALRAETDAFRVEIDTRIAETKRQTEADLETAKQAYEARLAYDEETRRIQREREERDANIRAQRQERDFALEDAARAKNAAAQIERIGTEESAREAAHLKAVAGFKGLEAIAVQFKGLVEGINLNGIAPKATGVNPFASVLNNTFGGGSSTPQPYVDPYPNLPPLQGVALPATEKTRSTSGQYALPTGSRNSSDLARNSLMPTGGGNGSGGAMVVTVPVTVQNLNVGSLVTPDEARQIATEVGMDIGMQVQDSLIEGSALAIIGARNLRGG